MGTAVADTSIADTNIADTNIADMKKSGTRASGQMLGKLAREFEQLLETLSWLMRAHDPGTYRHSVAVAELAVAIGERMGLADGEVDALRQAGLIHDVGKVALPQSILQKPGRLNERERALVQRHPDIGCTMLDRWDALKRLIPAVRHHHEWYDGSGYPTGLVGEQIPLTARILAVADSYDAMTRTRAYRAPLTREAARAELAGNAGTQFDPEVVDAFLGMTA